MNKKEVVPGEKVKAYITKYVLSRGIFEVIGQVANTSCDMLAYKQESYSFEVYAHGNDWHLSKEDANKRALAMVHNKLRALDKQRAKLVALEQELMAS